MASVQPTSDLLGSTLRAGHDNPYWGSEGLALGRSLVAGVGAAALAARLHRRATGERSN